MFVIVFCVLGGQRSTSGAVVYALSTLYFETGFLGDPGTRPPGIHLSLPYQLYLQLHATMVSLFSCVLEMKLRVLGLHGKFFGTFAH